MGFVIKTPDGERSELYYEARYLYGSTLEELYNKLALYAKEVLLLSTADPNYDYVYEDFMDDFESTNPVEGTEVSVKEELYVTFVTEGVKCLTFSSLFDCLSDDFIIELNKKNMDKIYAMVEGLNEQFKKELKKSSPYIKDKNDMESKSRFKKFIRYNVNGKQ